MIWLSNSAVARLRDRLRAQGRRPSVVMNPSGETDLDALELQTAAADYGAFCEAMYLMMSADGTVGSEEREVLKGALRSLSEGAVRSVHIEALLDQAAKDVAEQGRDARLRDVVARLHDDRARAEVAFMLAAAVAFADNAIADEENETLADFAEG